MNKLLLTAALKVVAYIEENIKAGIDYEGNKFQYSQKPFYRPFSESIYKKLGKSNKGKLYEIVTSKNGKKGMIILGYDQYKKYMSPNTYNTYLTYTGSMLRSLTLIKIDNNQAIIGFTNRSDAEKAYYLNVSGAGKSRKLWKFLGITTKQKEILLNEIGEQFKNIIINSIIKGA